MEKLQDLVKKLKEIKEALNKSQEAPAQEVVEKAEMNSLDFEIVAKSLEDAGHRQSALLLKTWGEVDNVAEEFVKSYVVKNEKKGYPAPSQAPAVAPEELEADQLEGEQEAKDRIAAGKHP